LRLCRGGVAVLMSQIIGKPEAFRKECGKAAAVQDDEER
jgi:hypothetical protein